MSIQRISASIFVLLVAVTAFAGDTHRYIVAMKPGRLPIPEAVAVAEPGQAAGDVAVGSDVEFFKHLDAYAADMTAEEAAALRLRPDVRYVEKSTEFRALGNTAGTTASTSDSSTQSRPWGITAVHAPEVWSVTRGNAINVAVVDTGIDYNHPDLKPNYAGGLNATVLASDPKRNDPMDDAGHGTHVSGTVAAADDGAGVVGVAPNARLWGVKVLGADGKGSLANIASGINWVIDKKTTLGGDWIINMSLGQCTDTTNTDCSAEVPLILQEACTKAADAGILIVAAAGNESSVSTGHIAPVGYPAAFPTVVAVAAVDALSALADFSSQGPQVAVAAPGVAIKSTYRLGQGSNSFVATSQSGYDGIALVGSLRGRITAPFVYCGIGNRGDFPSNVSGKIALIQRGGISTTTGEGLTFNEKVRNAKSAGAIAAVIFNKEDGPFNGTMIGNNPDDLTYAWPISIGISKADGEALLAASGEDLTLVNETGDFTYLQGTSMASPHVAGAAALIWSADPTASASAVRNAMTTTAHDLGAPGQDSAFGFGLIDSYAAAKTLAPWKFGHGTTPAPTVMAFTASSSRVAFGESATLTWTTSAATSAAIDGVGDVATNGSAVVFPRAATTVYTLRVTGPGGMTTANVNITVVQEPPSGRKVLRRRG